MQIIKRIGYKLLIILGSSIFWQHSLSVSAQSAGVTIPDPLIRVNFVKPEAYLKAGQLHFNIIRIHNSSDTAIGIKPILILPDDWKLLSFNLKDTIVGPHDSISLPFRYQLSTKVSSEIVHEVVFRAYSFRNKLLAENRSVIHSEVYHDWELVMPEERTFFYPGMDMGGVEFSLVNNGNATELINLKVIPDDKVSLVGTEEPWVDQVLQLQPYQDTVIRLIVKYASNADQVFDLSKVEVKAETPDKNIRRTILLEKYNTIYSPFFIDRRLPHQAEIGFRTFSGNDEVLPFVKARGIQTFKNGSNFMYNFNYYAITGNENLISNSYYSFLYQWKNFRAGIGAFSSSLGRNLYTRHGVMLSNMVKLSPALALEAFVCQSFFTPKTSVALGYLIGKEKLNFHGSFAYDVDDEKKVKTASAMLQSNLFTVFRKHKMSFNLYGFHENHYQAMDYTYFGVGWDINYLGWFGDRFTFQLMHNFGSPDIPGPQMGLLSFQVNTVYKLGDGNSNVKLKYVNSSKDYYAYNYEGDKLPNTELYDQYAILSFSTNQNPAHTFELGPSLEMYHSFKPSTSSTTSSMEFFSQKLRLEYKGTIYNNMTLNIKTGMNSIKIIEDTEENDLRYDFHLQSAFGFKGGLGLSFNYDYGPMVNTGLYQSAQDTKNHSVSLGPSLRSVYFKGRLSVGIFANLMYRLDIQNFSANINPKIEAYLYRNWYIVANGTYHYIQQQKQSLMSRSSFSYMEMSLMKKFGKSDYNRSFNNTRSLRVVMFRDDNGNGEMDPGEDGIPFVKTRVKLVNAPNMETINRFPVDITLLSNDDGIVIYNKLPTGFYDLEITPLTDLKEYFYVDRSFENIELTKTTTYFIPFQKATKISGKIILNRERFIREGEEQVDLTNIKVTAYNTQGNSYSSFTLSDGSFVVFVPGNNTYYLRIQNVFGSRFKIEKNDILVKVVGSAGATADFNVYESSRKVSFKQAKPAGADTITQAPLKIKILHGKFYENRSDTAVDRNAIPEFNMQAVPESAEPMIPGSYYVVVGYAPEKEEAIRIWRIFRENGIEVKLGYDAMTEKHYVFTNHYRSQNEARSEVDKLKGENVKMAEIFRVE